MIGGAYSFTKALVEAWAAFSGVTIKTEALAPTMRGREAAWYLEDEKTGAGLRFEAGQTREGCRYCGTLTIGRGRGIVTSWRPSAADALLALSKLLETHRRDELELRMGRVRQELTTRREVKRGTARRLEP